MYTLPAAGSISFRLTTGPKREMIGDGPAGMANTYEYIVNRSHDFITLVNRDYVYEIFNDTYCQIVGLDRAKVLNHSVAEIWGKETFDDRLKGYLDRCFAGEEVHYVERFRFGLEQRYMHVSYYPYGEPGDVTHALVFSHDITRLGETETRLINYEYRDPLTGLYNRKSLEIILDSELEKARRSRAERNRAVLFLGVENLTEIHRIYGHSIGGVLLENTGLRVKELLRSSDYVFRYEGNELAAILTSLTRPVDVAKVADKLIESTTTPYRYKDLDITLDCRIGAAVFPADGQDRESLVASARSALNETTRQGKGYLLYDGRLHEEAIRRLQMENDLRHAFEQEQFELYYQPIVEPAGRIVGAEALIRWNRPEEGVLPPVEFIPLATETGIIRLIGRWALFSAARRLAEWGARHAIYLSVNLTAREFESPELIEVIRKALDQAGLRDGISLKVEITESECMANPVQAIERIKAIRDLGVEVFIDDFGTGQSSLGYLKDLPVDAFKIDRTFAQGLLDDPADLHFLQTIIDLVKSRRRKVIVEGVSSPQQVAVLRTMDCDAFQGFYYSQPLSAAAFLSCLERGGRLPA